MNILGQFLRMLQTMREYESAAGSQQGYFLNLIDA